MRVTLRRVRPGSARTLLIGLVLLPIAVWLSLLLVDHARAGTSAAASSSGTIVFQKFTASGDYSVWRMKPDGSGRRRLARNTTDGGSGDGLPSIGARGPVVFIRAVGDDFQLEVFRADRDGRRVRRLTRSRRGTIRPTVAISRGGARIAYVKNTGLWVMRADGSRARRVLAYPSSPRGGHTIEGVSFSPDGRQLTFVHTETTPRSPRENEELVVVSADGSGRRVLGPREAELNDPRFSPDGSQILFGCGDFDKPSLCTITADGRDRRTLIADASWSDFVGSAGPRGAWSPSGDQIVFDCAKRHLCIADADGTNRRDLGIGAAPDWG